MLWSISFRKTLPSAVRFPEDSQRMMATVLLKPRPPLYGFSGTPYIWQTPTDTERSCTWEIYAWMQVDIIYISYALIILQSVDKPLSRWRSTRNANNLNIIVVGWIGKAIVWRVIVGFALYTYEYSSWSVLQQCVFYIFLNHLTTRIETRSILSHVKVHL